jgi:hypothetical protein
VMKPKILLRIASIIMLLHVVGHSIGHAGWKHADDAEKQQIIEGMTGKKFPFMGMMRSMGEFYDGYGYASTVAMLFTVGLLWLVSSSPEISTRLAINTLWLCTVYLVGWGGVELVYFFPFAASFSIISGVLTLLAAVKVRNTINKH